MPECPWSERCNDISILVSTIIPQQKLGYWLSEERVCLKRYMDESKACVLLLGQHFRRLY